MITNSCSYVIDITESAVPADLAAELLGGRDRGLRVGVEDLDVGLDAGSGHRGGHPGIPFVHVS